MSTGLAPRLDAYLMEAARPFDWATHNCCHFAGRWVQLVEGRDPLHDMPHTPDARSARRLARWLGGLGAAITYRLARDPIAPAAARLGDIVLMPTSRFGGPPAGLSAGICVGNSAALGVAVAVFITEEGATVYWPVSDAVHAWRIDEARSAAPPAQTSAQGIAA